MKLLYPLIFVALYVTYRTYVYATAFQRNLKAARRSGLPYILSPVYPLNRTWLIFARLLVPRLKKIPWVGDGEWLNVSGGDWFWERRYAHFEKYGDTFIIVTPVNNVAYTAEAGLISQITTRRNDFPKPLRVYGTISMYGDNVVGTEGNEWRRHRKVTSPPFTEKNNHLVWKESLYQAKNMLTQWVGFDGKGNMTWDNISNDAMRLSLHVISRAGFNVRCLWPGIDDNDEKALQEGAMSTAIIPEGHKMSYVEAMQTLLHRIIFALLCSDWFASTTSYRQLALRVLTLSRLVVLVVPEKGCLGQT